MRAAAAAQVEMQCGGLPCIARKSCTPSSLQASQTHRAQVLHNHRARASRCRTGPRGGTYAVTAAAWWTPCRYAPAHCPASVERTRLRMLNSLHQVAFLGLTPCLRSLLLCAVPAGSTSGPDDSGEDDIIYLDVSAGNSGDSTAALCMARVISSMPTQRPSFVEQHTPVVKPAHWHLVLAAMMLPAGLSCCPQGGWGLFSNLATCRENLAVEHHPLLLRCAACRKLSCQV